MIAKRDIYGPAIGLLILGLFGCTGFKDVPLATSVPGENNYCELKAFTGTYNSGKVYVNWVVNTNINNYYLILEKSVNGEEFKTVQIRKGFASPTKEGLYFSYVDEFLTADSRVYRIRAVQPIKSGDKLVLYTGNKNLFKDCENAAITVINENSSASK